MSPKRPPQKESGSVRKILGDIDPTWSGEKLADLDPVNLSRNYKPLGSSDPRAQAITRARLLLEDAEPWAKNILRQPPPRPIDLDRMAAAILDALKELRSA